MIYISQPAVALHSVDVPGFRYQMQTTWNMPVGASATSVVYWISYAVDHSPELELKNVVINCHGGPGNLYVGGLNSPPVGAKDVAIFGALRTKDIGTVWLVGCLVAIGAIGQQFCSAFAGAIGTDVVAANDEQFVERRYAQGNSPFGTIDDFEGTAYRFSPSGSKEVLSVHDPQAETELSRVMGPLTLHTTKIPWILHVAAHQDQKTEFLKLTAMKMTGELRSQQHPVL